MTRTFYMLRVHDGIADCVAQGTGDTIECSSSLFSTYMLTYRDEKVKDDKVPVTDDSKDDGSGGDSDGGSSSAKTVKTGDSSFLFLWVAVLVIAVILGGIMLFILRKRQDRK